jgi:hypothetical protein
MCSLDLDVMADSELVCRRLQRTWRSFKVRGFVHSFFVIYSVEMKLTQHERHPIYSHGDSVDGSKYGRQQGEAPKVEGDER